ncbi:MAG TPA: hypothetical protein VN326_01010 [Casimicrobiaceae bacterium]|nr:hypothetical protein [Casimicrobiaceae bacterium]
MVFPRAWLLVGALTTGIAPHGWGSATLIGCPLFPSDNVWNTAIDTLPVDANSSAYVATIGAAKPVHPDFGTVYNGIPFITVGASQAKVPISFNYAGESDPGPYPIPPDAPIEGGPQAGGDRRVLVLDCTAGKLYELFAAYPNADGSWVAGSGAVFDVRGNSLRPSTWTSADAAGLPILAGLVRYDYVAAGEIAHALRFTAPQTRNTFIWPARHQASSLSGTQYPPMGQRFRLKASVDISSFGRNVQIILRALKKYGMFLADNGSSWFLSGAPDPRWNDDELRQLSLLHGSDFEAVDESSLMIDPNSAQARPPPPTQPPAGEVPVIEYYRAAVGSGLSPVQQPRRRKPSLYDFAGGSRTDGERRLDRRRLWRACSCDVRCPAVSGSRLARGCEEWQNRRWTEKLSERAEALLNSQL